QYLFYRADETGLYLLNCNINHTENVNGKKHKYSLKGPFNPPNKTLKLPLNYKDAFVTESEFYQVIDVDGLGQRAKSILLRDSVTVDAWGQLITPFGTFNNVFRVKNIRYSTSREDKEVSGKIMEGTTLYQKDTIYQWWIAEGSFPLMELTCFGGPQPLGEEQNLDTQYFYSFFTKVDIENNKSAKTFSAIPNLEANSFIVQGPDKVLSLRDSSGQEVKYSVVNMEYNKFELTLTNPLPGEYTAIVVTEGELSFVKIVVL
ncbi:MAG: hypothetical protein ACK4ND_19950, partial [Cytophagaceae bacterium]